MPIRFNRAIHLFNPIVPGMQEDVSGCPEQAPKGRQGERMQPERNARYHEMEQPGRKLRREVSAEWPSRP
ncbi:MAG: hypothetical protein ACXWLB_12970 [Reyranella sp.]